MSSIRNIHTIIPQLTDCSW